MSHRIPDFDLRPRRGVAPMTMWSTLQVDDDDDTLAALAAAASARGPGGQGDARHAALAAMPSTLCAWSPWPPRLPPMRRAAVPVSPQWMLGPMVSATLAVLMLVAAMLWRLEHPRVVHVEGAAAAVRSTPAPEIDAMSSASPPPGAMR